MAVSSTFTYGSQVFDHRDRLVQEQRNSALIPHFRSSAGQHIRTTTNDTTKSLPITPLKAVFCRPDNNFASKSLQSIPQTTSAPVIGSNPVFTAWYRGRVLARTFLTDVVYTPRQLRGLGYTSEYPEYKIQVLERKFVYLRDYINENSEARR